MNMNIPNTRIHLHYSALASAKSQFDGSEWCFNVCCFSFSPCIVRNYVRMGYEIDGRVGYSDCFCPTLCAPCAITQLLNETNSRGQKISSVKTNIESPWLAEKKEYSCLGDPCDFLCTFVTCPCEVANVYAQLSGAVSTHKLSLCLEIPLGTFFGEGYVSIMFEFALFILAAILVCLRHQLLPGATPVAQIIWHRWLRLYR